ncbi:MAG: TetR family transcriptional regulator [Actinomycetota bacterium]
MTTARRIGAEDSTTRVALLDAAQALLEDEGYAAVTSRRVAAKAGVTPPLVHYYFRTMDDLLVALVRRGAEQSRERQAAALASDQPLWALWETTTDPAGRTVITEMAALANHRKDLRAEIAALAGELRAEQIAALAPVLDRYGVERRLTPEAVATLVNALGQNLVMERALGLDSGHAAVRALVEDLLTRYEGPRR